MHSVSLSFCFRVAKGHIAGVLAMVYEFCQVASFCFDVYLLTCN